MDKGEYAMFLENKLATLVKKYNFSYHVAPTSKLNLADFKSIVTAVILDLLPKDNFLFLKAVENIEENQFEIFVKINSAYCMFRSAIDDEDLGMDFWEKIYKLPKYSEFDLELFSVCNEFGLCEMNVCFISGSKASLSKAYNEGLPILHPSQNIWYFWLDFKKVNKSKLFYLHIDLTEILSKIELKQLFIKGIESGFTTKNIPLVLETQLEIVDLSAKQIKRRLPFLEGPLKFELWVGLFINGCNTQSSLLVTKNGLYLRGRFADFIWAYGIGTKYNAKVHLIPYSENSALPFECEPPAFFSWINNKLNDYPELNII